MSFGRKLNNCEILEEGFVGSRVLVVRKKMVGERVRGGQVCQRCGRVVCDGFADTLGGKRFCRACYAEVKSLMKLG